ncbi:MAG: PKD domain-containing protein [Solirubrobacteraceae bacterium]
MLPPLSHLRQPRRPILASGLATTIAAALLLTAAPAGAVISGSFGLQQRAGATVEEAPLAYHGGPVLHSSDAYVIYWDPVGSYRPEWERTIDEYFANVSAESGSLGDVFAVDTQYSDGTGHAANQTTFRGSYKDKDPYPAGGCGEPAAHVCLTDSQIQAELQHMITSVDPPLPGATGTPVYYMLTPPGVTVCAESGAPDTCSNSVELETEVTEGKRPAKSGICGYHSAIGLGGASPIPYVVQPWIAGDAGTILSNHPPVTAATTGAVLACQNGFELQEPNQIDAPNPEGGYVAGLADVLISDLSIEQQDVVDDPDLTGWYQTATKAEQGDMCQFDFGPPPESAGTPNKLTQAGSEANQHINTVSYYLPWSFDSTDLTSGKGYTCWSGVALEPDFTAPSPVFAGDIVGFNGTESYIALDAEVNGLPADEPFVAPIYAWNFGDGTTVAGVNDASEFHSYEYGGEYTVTLTVTDSGENTVTTTRKIKVVGPPPPGAGAGAGGSGAGSSPGASGVVPAPIAAATIVRQSLRTALRKGLVVSYSVNEQVAGHFEVLLSSATAHRLGISGTPATGLPAGSAPKLVIAKAILVTTKGGHNAVHIQFSKRTAARLAHVHKLSLMLRLIVRNAATSNPATTTVVSSVTLGA